MPQQKWPLCHQDYHLTHKNGKPETALYQPDPK
jgi:hypothetical protein